jgi:hypothetical protein
MTEEEKYLNLLQEIMEKQQSLLGEKVAEGKARSAPLEITPEGDIDKYYGEGQNAVDLLIQQYEKVWGTQNADKKIKRTVRGQLEPKDYDLVPERIRPEEKQKMQGSGIVGKMKKAIL